MAYTDIDKPTDYFRVKTYSGNSSTQSITWDESDNMKPDWLWLKGRGYADGHALVDVIRGSTKNLSSDSTTAEFTQTNGVTSFDTNGWSMGNWSAINRSTSGTAVGWGWLAGGTASSNTDGSITSSVSASATSGFSIVSYTGNATAGATIGHGLGAVPSVILTKNRDFAYNWHLWTHAFSSFNDTIQLNTTAAIDTGTLLNNTAPTSSVITLGSSAVLNASGEKIIAYVFAEKKGFSKFGSYTGNGNADGTFVYTGFKPAWLMIKRTDSADAWFMFDNKRAGAYSPNTNPSWEFLLANATNTGANTDRIDLYSNGFKMRFAWDSINASGGSYIYMAFAESPFVTSTGIPTTAR